MRTRDWLLSALILPCCLALAACSKHQDPLQSALDELKRLGAFTETGLNYSEYSDRLLTATGNIAVALQHSHDMGAKAKIDAALNLYVQAQDDWRRNVDHDDGRASILQDYWTRAKEATANASSFILADPAGRKRILAQELAAVEAAIRADEEEARQAEAAENARKAREAEALARQRAAEQKQLADETERERVRRFAPAGTVYSLKRITFNTADGVISVPLGTELKVVSTGTDGMVRVQKGDLETEVLASAVTNDRDLVTAMGATVREIQNAGKRSVSRQIAGANQRSR